MTISDSNCGSDPVLDYQQLCYKMPDQFRDGVYVCRFRETQGMACLVSNY